MVVGLKIPNWAATPFNIVPQVEDESQGKINDNRRAYGKKSTVNKKQANFAGWHPQLVAQVATNAKEFSLNKRSYI